MEQECYHRWRREHEEFILGGSFPVGWQCTRCGKFVSNSELTPHGLQGEITKEHRVVGSHGGTGRTSDGRRYKEQIVHEDGSLKVVYAE